jgi:hypothetical protein
MNTLCKTPVVAAQDIIKDIEAQRLRFDKANPSVRRLWYVSTGASIEEFAAKYPPEKIYIFHHYSKSKKVLDEVLTHLLKSNKNIDNHLADFLSTINVPTYIFNYCFVFK